MGASGSSRSLKKLDNAFIKYKLKCNPGIAILYHEKDGRIIFGTEDGAIVVFTLDSNQKTLKEDCFLEQAHSECITCIAGLSGNRFVTGSMDFTIKVWLLKSKEILIQREIFSHENAVTRVVPIKERKMFASCSIDSTIRIWKSENHYEQLALKTVDKKALMLDQLECNQHLISTHMNNEKDKNSFICIWKLEGEEKDLKITEVKRIESEADFQPLYVWNLPGERFGVSSINSLIVFDVNNYKKLAHINDGNWSSAPSSLCVLDSQYIYVTCSGYLCQILLKDYSLSFREKLEQLHGESLIFLGKKGDLILTTQKDYIYVMKCTY